MSPLELIKQKDLDSLMKVEISFYLFILLNRWSLGDFTKMEGTQMEMFNFLWLI